MARAQSFARTTQRIDSGSGLLPRERRTRPLGSLGKYRLLERIGHGSTGDVYRAEHVLLGRRVALKVLRDELASDERQVERFFAEARAINLVGHRNVIEVTDYAREPDGTAWFVMELLEGGDLASRLRDGRLPLRDALLICEQLCAALGAVHAVGIIHHDVKPENVFLARQDGQDVVKLVDFGIARLPDDPVDEEDDTFNGVVIGSPPYMAPEQACGMVTDLRADLYAVGAVLFELVTGRPLFERPDTRALLEAVVFDPPPLASAHADLPASVRAGLDELLQRCLAKQPTRRPASAAALGAELAALRGRLEASMSTSLARKVPARVMALDESSGEVAVARSELLARCRPAWHKPALWLSAAAVLLAGAAWAAPTVVLPEVNLRAALPGASSASSPTPAAQPSKSAATAVPAASPRAPQLNHAATAVPAAPASPASAPQLNHASAASQPHAAQAAPAVGVPAVAAPPVAPRAPTAEPRMRTEAAAEPNRSEDRQARESSTRRAARRARAALQPEPEPEPPTPPVAAISSAADPRPVLRVTALSEPPPAPTPQPEAGSELAPQRDSVEPGDDLTKSELLDPYEDE